MVVRHLGDLTTSVANTPSDGRERAIADALLVLNTAPLGPVARLLVRDDAPTNVGFVCDGSLGTKIDEPPSGA